MQDILHGGPLLPDEYAAHLLLGEHLHGIWLVVLVSVQGEFDLSEAALADLLHDDVLVDFFLAIALPRRYHTPTDEGDARLRGVVFLPRQVTEGRHHDGWVSLGLMLWVLAERGLRRDRVITVRAEVPRGRPESELPVVGEDVLRLFGVRKLA